jgi:capsular polysaccharide biosynthesis protein
VAQESRAGAGDACAEAGAPPGKLLTTVGYDELCIGVDVADIADAGQDAIAHVAATASCHPSAPVDYGGILGPEPEVPSRLVGNANHPEAWWAEPFQSPALYAASVGDVLCFGGLPHGEHTSGHLLLVRNRFIVPDSYFARSTMRSLPADLITSVDTAEQGTFRLKVDDAGIATQVGQYYFAGAAWGHFGHFLLEGLSRWWLLARLPEPVRAELRIVLYNDRPLPGWQLELLEGLGVAAERLLYLTEPMRFERMIVPSVAYNLHCAAASVQADTWEHIGRSFDRGEGPARVYLSRARYNQNRVLIDETEVERRFQARGFTVLHPQELSIADQIASIRHARLIAGSAGSAMYLSAFARQGAQKLVISPRNFTFRDDQLISYVRGEQIAYVLCATAPDQENKNPRMADYRVALDVLDTAIDRWIAGCG